MNDARRNGAEVPPGTSRSVPLGARGIEEGHMDEGNRSRVLPGVRLLARNQR